MFNISTKCILKKKKNNNTYALSMIMRAVLFCPFDGNDPRVSASKQMHLNDWAEMLFLAPNRRQVIIWIYDDLVYRRKQASPGVNELKANMCCVIFDICFYYGFRNMGWCWKIRSRLHTPNDGIIKLWISGAQMAIFNESVDKKYSSTYLI